MGRFGAFGGIAWRVGPANMMPVHIQLSESVRVGHGENRSLNIYGVVGRGLVGKGLKNRG